MNELILTQSECVDVVNLISDVVDDLSHSETYPLDLAGNLFYLGEEELNFLKEKLYNVINNQISNINFVIFESQYGKFKIIILEL